MENYSTTFGYLVDLCGIKSVQLAGYLHVDRSLIGKWKSGTRLISKRTEYLDNIVQYFLENERYIGECKALFVSLFNEDYEEEKLGEYLRFFICSNNISLIDRENKITKATEYLYESSIYVYKGIEGRKKAFEEFMDFGLSIEEYTSMILNDSSGWYWLLEDEVYSRNFIDKVLRYVEKGNEIKIGITLEEGSQSSARVNNYFYPFMQMPNFNICYLRPIGSATYVSTFVIKGKIAMTGYCAEGDSEKTYSQISYDPLTIAQHTEIANNYFKQSQIKYKEAHLSYDEKLKWVENSSYIDSDTYLLVHSPSFYSMDYDLMEKILDYNSVTEEQREEIIRWREIFDKCFMHPKNLKNNRIRLIHDLSVIKQMLTQECVFYTDNLFSNHCTIQVDQEDFRKHLQYLLKIIYDNPLVQIGLIPERKEYGGLNAFGYREVKKNCWYMDSQSMGSNFTRIDELVELQYIGLQKIWQEIPSELKNKDNIKKIVEEFITTMK